jgi:hypothetical protein
MQEVHSFHRARRPGDRVRGTQGRDLPKILRRSTRLSPSRTHALDLDRLQLPRLDLVALVERFTEEEVWGVIKSLPPDKVPGPDGFTARFFQVA